MLILAAYKGPMARAEGILGPWVLGLGGGALGPRTYGLPKAGSKAGLGYSQLQRDCEGMPQQGPECPGSDLVP